MPAAVPATPDAAATPAGGPGGAAAAAGATPGGAVGEAASELLRRLAGPDAVLRDDQLTAIAALVEAARPVLVVQRTGWGKSAVYWVATALRRRVGAGPTLVVSPLLALMRDQVAAAERMGLAAATINSTNVDDWRAVAGRLDAGELDVLLVSPERLNAPAFRAAVLPDLARRVGTLVIDECHCISDWGHDFRPDYRRLRALVDDLAPGVAVLATTATANARVTADVAAQLGRDTLTLRGGLGRDSLELAVVDLPTAAERLAWVAAEVATAPGSGIVYCLTVAETARVAAFLAGEGLAVAAYSGDADPATRQAVEDDLRANRLQAVVATSALGMGFDKPDLAFVVHLGSPPSPIAYYQQVGRAGRALPHARATLLPTPADRDVWAWFESTALPPEPVVRAVLDAVTRRGPVSVPALESVVNLRRTRIEAVLKVLDVEGAVRRVPDGWIATGAPWAYDHERVERVKAARAAEAAAMVAYAAADRCRMQFLQEALDDPGAGPCGHCDVCAPAAFAPRRPDPAVAGRALAELRRAEVVIEPRRQWPGGVSGRKGAIPPARRAETGRALALGNDPAWADEVRAALAADEPGPELLEGVIAALRRWRWERRPAWVTWVPSARHPGLGATVARHIAEVGRLPVHEALRRVDRRPPQAELANSSRQAGNVVDAFAVDLPGGVPDGPVLVVDDTWASGWTMTVVADALRAAGSGPVLPFVCWRRP
ncbi:MAG TPA: RecQ family ATP-dependent DNA helicase [Acidimicrobiales bacterium]|nr:RecQ family ATP-dependent DNA helicase [Acidimicrobiales bacterium]